MSSLFLIIGLGNPGPRYSQTRHNAGFWFLDTLLKNTGSDFRVQARLSAETCRVRLHDRDCIIAKPTTFMNHSGQAVRAVTDYFRISSNNLLVAYDELDLPPGTARLKQGGGHGGHNGMRDIFRHMDDTDFMRLRIGIGHPGVREAVTGYVLSRAPADQENAILDSIGDAVRVMPELLSGNISAAMKDLHTPGPSQGAMPGQGKP